MSIENIGTNIARLRKEKSVKQEELATHVGISTQAVSKWENGGAPDTELLPKIADFFEVSIDALFGRSIADYGNLEIAVANKVSEMPDFEDKIKYVFELCWLLQQAYTKDSDHQYLSLKEVIAGNKSRHPHIRSRLGFDGGYSHMSLNETLPYFLLAPTPADKDLAYFDGMDYPAFFAMLADKNVFDTIVHLYKRDLRGTLTLKFLADSMKTTEEEMARIIAILQKLKMVVIRPITLDDSTSDVYEVDHFRAPNFLALLTFARYQMVSENVWQHASNGGPMPYL